ncbi:TPPP3 [Symbiodinium natans]|uniref:TPPP3 protein n=1 Tax=Symbiodinium natans TaxID=878477 RepID=A0A812IEV1_9DINO|nr:TPPP3 [Symbiodinium natans]
MASASTAALLESFQAFAGGTEMDGRTWVKCLKDSMLLDEDFTTVDADLIFARVKSRGTRKIDYPTFRRALSEVAKKWQMSQEQVEDIICLAAGPHYENQIQAPEPGIDDPAGPQRFYYDMTLYTGTHKYGGPSLVGNGIVEGAPVNFQEHVNRDRDNEVAASADRRRRAVLGAEAGEEMPRLLGKPRSPLAQRREIPKGRRPVAQLKGPERFFYDKASYTGTHKHGGPSVHGNGLPKQGYEDLSELVRRDHVQDDELHRQQRLHGGYMQDEYGNAIPVAGDACVNQGSRAAAHSASAELPTLLGSPRRRGAASPTQLQQVEVSVKQAPQYEAWPMPSAQPVAHKVYRTESTGWSASVPGVPGTVISPQVTPQVQYRATAQQPVARTVQTFPTASPAWYSAGYMQVPNVHMPMPMTTAMR